MLLVPLTIFSPVPSREVPALMAFTPISGDDVLFDHPLPWFSQTERNQNAGPDDDEDDEFDDDDFDEDDEFDEFDDDELDEDDEFDDDEDFEDIDDEEEDV